MAFDPSRRVCRAFRPAVCRGPHLYQKGRPELAFDPSRRFGSEFRPTRFAGRSVPLPGPSLVSDGAPGTGL